MGNGRVPWLVVVCKLGFSLGWFLLFGGGVWRALPPEEGQGVAYSKLQSVQCSWMDNYYPLAVWQLAVPLAELWLVVIQ